MAVLNKRAIVSAIEMYGVSSIRLPKVLGESFAATIRNLFANGEQGFFYDPNDLSTMFQDSAGTVPVTAAGQPVGLMLDKSKGLKLGEELWENATPTISDLEGTTGSYDPVSKTMRNTVPSSANARPIFRFPFAWQAGKRYLFKGKFKSGYEKLYLNSIRFGGGTGFTQVPVNQMTGEFSAIATSPDNLVSIIFAIGQAGDIVIDYISIKEVLGNHAYQTTSASRPILRQNVITGAYYLEFDGSDDFLVTNSIDFTVTDKISLFTGIRKLSDAASALCFELGNGTSSITNSFSLFAPAASGVRRYDLRNSPDTLGAFTVDNKFNAPSSAVLSGFMTPNSMDKISLRINSSLVATTQTGSSGNLIEAPLYIGRRGGTTLPFNGHIYGLIGVGNLASDNETTAIEKELAKRTGVTLNV